MPIQLPQDPTNGQQVTTGGKTYQWNGRFWKIVASTSTGGGASGPAAWADITDKPTSFTPAAHAHSIGSVVGLTEALDNKQPVGSYLTAETEPAFTASPAAGITGQQVSNWNTAHGWGNHAGAGYLLSSSIGVTVQGYSANTVIDGSYVHTDNNFTTALLTKLNGIAAGATANTGTVTSVGVSVPSGFSASSAVTSSGTLAITFAAGYSLPSDATQATWTAKQAALVSGTNIKTVNGQSLLGSGDLAIAGGGASYAISATAPNPATYPIWFTLTGEQFVWDGEAWFQVPGVPGADGQDGVDGQDGTGSSQSAILSWAI